MDTHTAITLLTMVATAGVAFGGARAGMNGTKERVKDISKMLKEHIADEADTKYETVQRLTAVETTLSTLSRKVCGNGSDK